MILTSRKCKLIDPITTPNYKRFIHFIHINMYVFIIIVSIELFNNRFKINFSILMDCLNIYGNSTFVALQMGYGGYGSTLVLM